ncbi:MAG: Maf family protein [Synergistaceae bacterium]|nr:Maf family protein [Synergistaceae bacterium]
MTEDIILASASPRRRELLAALGWKFSVEPPRVEEKMICGENPRELAARLAAEKADEVAGRFPGKWVVGADTVVAVDGRALGKPRDEAEAAAMLRLLSGRAHSVFTGVALVAPDGGKRAGCEETKVHFRRLTDDEIADYIAQGESMDKAGAYAVQGSGALLADRIEGCYFNIVGLPLFRLSALFEELGLPLAEQWRVER